MAEREKFGYVEGRGGGDRKVKEGHGGSKAVRWRRKWSRKGNEKMEMDLHR